MKFESVAEIYEFNDSARKRLIGMVGELSAEAEKLPTENGKWDVAKVVEHLAKVESGMMSIAMRLLTAAKDQGLKFSGVALSPNFVEQFEKILEEDKRLEAPGVVQPEGGKPISESLAAMDKNRQQLNMLRPMFEEYEGTKMTFPHPVFGGLTAIDWLTLIGGHESRHTDQIERILSRGNAAEA